MTDKDTKLIEEAKKLDCTDWGLAFDYAKDAETEQAKQELERIGKSLYHREEAQCGCI